MNAARAVRVGGLTRALLDSHSLMGVVFGAFVYMICLSGALAVVADELELWERPDAPFVGRADPPLIAHTAASAIVAARAAHMRKIIFLDMGTPDLPRTTVLAIDGKGGEREWNADAAGRLVPRATAPWSEFIREHHASLNLPQPFGGWVVGLIGTALLASLFSGLLAHRRIVRDAFRLRWGGSRRLANADLHNRIGVWALPFHFIVALTGSLLGLASLIILVLAMVAFKGDRERAIGALTGPPAIVDARPAPLPDVAAIARSIEERVPGAQIESIHLDDVGTRGQGVRMLVDTPGYLTRADEWIFDGDGRLVAKLGLTDGPVGMRIYGMLTPLHYGTYSGILLKLVYMALGLGMATVVATGAQILLARRREQGRASAAWDRVWDGVVWGQPVALLLSGIAAIGAHLAPLPVYWIASIAIVLACAMRSSMTRPKALKIAIGCCAVALAVAHASLIGWPGAQAGTIDLSLLLVGGGFVLGRLSPTSALSTLMRGARQVTPLR